MKVFEINKKIKIYYMSLWKSLSHTTNGIQVAVLNEKGTALVEKTPGLAILERIYDELD